MPHARKKIAYGTLSMVAGGVLLYFGYCWGWWLRDNLLAQSLFQCNCPEASEAVRYAPFRLVASGCNDPLVRVSPSGTHLLITERAARPPVTRLVDVVSGSRTVLPDATLSTIFVTDTLIINLRGVKETTLVDLLDPTRPPRRIERYQSWQLATDQHDEAGILYVLRDEQRIIFVPTAPNAPGFHIRSFSSFIPSDGWSTQPERTIIVTTGARQLTPTRATWVVDGRGIFNRTTQTLLVATGRQAAIWPLRPWMDPLPFQPVGWLVGDRGVIYRYDYSRAFLIDVGSGVPFTGRLGSSTCPSRSWRLMYPRTYVEQTDGSMTCTPGPSPPPRAGCETSRPSRRRRAQCRRVHGAARPAAHGWRR